ncbi:hypothetical protein [Algoriphagus antarcticus]|uniref:Outer membrane protein with beta-barrel domain n=1 Tax=Algoriphagus antarcticus TaxID=238540 RepID=A0A3E0DNQ5_9BACT|nr:hypothetical protein [Algoriphagus antarcticus]REG84477.1 hypothetical protein C8N25_11552 [Algoriphagus antarcticus]
MVKILRLVTVLVLLSMPFIRAHAQGGYIEESVWSNVNPASEQASDFIITKNGEKLFGDVVSAYDFANYEKVDFEYRGSVKTYSPVDLKAFGLENGRFFMSKKLSESSEVEFVQILFSGRLQLDYKKGKYYLDNGTDIQELRSYYQDVPGEGSPKKRHIKLYISILKINTSGTCGFEMNDLIERSRVDEQDFIQIVTQYHACEELPYKLHVEKIPFAKISPTAAIGAGSEFTKSSDIPENFNYSFSKSLSYRAFLGFRLHDFRRTPKSSIDLRIGFMMRSATLEASSVTRAEVITASQEFKESSIFIPFSYNYSFFKKGVTDIYMGLVLTTWLSTLQNDLSIIEQTLTLAPNETILYEQRNMDVVSSSFSPGMKAGANFPLNSKMTLFTEFGVDFIKDYYTVQVLSSPIIHLNRTYLSFQVGIEF